MFGGRLCHISMKKNLSINRKGQDILMPYGPSFYGIFWGYIFLQICGVGVVKVIFTKDSPLQLLRAGSHTSQIKEAKLSAYCGGGQHLPDEGALVLSASSSH